MAMTDREVRVYVRKGTERGERWITFPIPDDISHSELMQNGWAIDGNQAILSVPITGLANKERQLMEWFRQKGYTTLFC